MTRNDTPTNDDERGTSADAERDDAATTRADCGRRRYLQATTAAVVGTVGLAGCTGGDGSSDGDGGSDGDSSDGDDGGDGDDGDDGGDGDGSETGVLSTRVTDDPGDIDDFESCVVSIAGYWLGPEPGTEAEDEDDEEANGTESAGTTVEGTASATEAATETEPDDEDDDAEATDEDDGDGEDDGESGGRQYRELEEPARADLVELQDDATQVVDEQELETGDHAYLQLDTDGVDAVLNDGSEATVEVPGEAPLKFNESFEIRANTRTAFTADFTPVQRGQGSRYLLQPVASGVEVSYEEMETDDRTTGAGNGEDGTTEAGGSDAGTTAADDDGTTAAE